jgi:predicted  nucleic acid-binding Zn-ribbon protein
VLEARVAEEAKATLLLRGENGFMKRRFVAVNKELAEQREDVAALAAKEAELAEAIGALQKDVAGHQKEVREREETICDKDARIYDLKKKNQVSR